MKDYDILITFSNSPSLEEGSEEMLAEYTEAERRGQDVEGCSVYYDECPHSIYTNVE